MSAYGESVAGTTNCAFGRPPAVTTPSKGRPGGRMSGLRNPSDTYTTSHQESHHGPAETPSRQHHSNGGPSVRVEKPISPHPFNAPDGNSAPPRRIVAPPPPSPQSLLADPLPHPFPPPSLTPSKIPGFSPLGPPGRG